MFKHNKNNFYTLETVLPQVALNKIISGVLPTIIIDKIVLKSNECCHYVDQSFYITSEKKTNRSGSGASFNIFKGFNYHINQSETTSLYNDVYNKGYLIITNQRIIFSSKVKGVDEKLENITAFNIVDDALVIQIKNKIYRFVSVDNMVSNKVLEILLK